MGVMVRIRLFAALAEAAGARELTLELPEGATARSAWLAVCTAHPRLSTLASSLVPAVNQQYAGWDQRLSTGDEVAFIPPVSGGDGLDAVRETLGAAGRTPRFRIQVEPLAIEPLAPLVEHPGAGAILYFVGVAREWTGGRRTVRLTYEAYPGMAEQEMARIGDEVTARWPEARLAIHHRIGPVAIGEASVIVAVSAPRRAIAYAASRHAIERLKEIVPIWKKETWEDGETWVGAQSGP